MNPPFTALLIRPPTTPTGDRATYSDTLTVRPVRVDKLDHGNRRALVTARLGAVEESRWVSFDNLATSEAAALEKIRPHFAALSGRAPKPALGVKTPDRTAAPSS